MTNLSDLQHNCGSGSEVETGTKVNFKDLPAVFDKPVMSD